MSTRITYHGAASFDIEGPEHRILIDPFLTGNDLAPCAPDELPTPDVILVSHAAVDHYGDTPAVAKRTGAPVICDAAVRAKLIDDGVDPDQITPTTWGIVVEVSGGLGHSTPAERARDAQRRNELQDIGVLVCEYTWEHVTRREGWVARTLEQRLRAAGWRP